MNQLSASDLTLLSKLLGLTGSAHDGEVINAARKAHELVKAKGATWPAILGLDAMPPSPDHVALARELLGKGRGICTPWEMRFLRGILAFKALSDYQRETLDGIREKVFTATSDMAFHQPTD
jgi:hypothetical protein